MQGGLVVYRLVFLMLFLLLVLPQIAMAAGGRVLYQDGAPAAGAEVIVTGGGGKKVTIVCDHEGRFVLENLPGEGAMIRIKAAEKGFAPVRLPVSLFENGEVAIVLQPGTEKKNSSK